MNITTLENGKPEEGRACQLLLSKVWQGPVLWSLSEASEVLRSLLPGARGPQGVCCQLCGEDRSLEWVFPRLELM